MGPFRSISAFIYRVSTRPVVLTALAGFIAFMIFVLPAQANQAESYAGGAGSPDTSFFYTPTDLYEMAEAYGPDGRAAYVQARYTFDVVWPLVYLAFLATTISWILARLIRPGNPWRLLNLVPVLATLFDWHVCLRFYGLPGQQPDDLQQLPCDGRRLRGLVPRRSPAGSHLQRLPHPARIHPQIHRQS
jgi:hypothetical protein